MNTLENIAIVEPVPGALMKSLFAELSAFLDPMAKGAGLQLRPFSVSTWSAMQLAGITVGNAKFAEQSETERTHQMLALLIIQTCPIEELKPALRAAAGDFEKFYWDFIFDRTSEIPLEAMAQLGIPLLPDPTAEQSTASATN